jgi:hypothetical protein
MLEWCISKPQLMCTARALPCARISNVLKIDTLRNINYARGQKLSNWTFTAKTSHKVSNHRFQLKYRGFWGCPACVNLMGEAIPVRGLIITICTENSVPKKNTQTLSSWPKQHFHAGKHKNDRRLFSDPFITALRSRKPSSVTERI